MKYKKNWEETQIKFEQYWKHENQGRPLMCVVARKDDTKKLPPELMWRDMDEKYLDGDKIVARYRHFCENHEFLGESFPNLSVDFGPGSVASYLGSEIVFHEDTVWFEEFVDDWEEMADFTFCEESKWFQKHVALVKRCRELAEDDFLVCIPDLMENIDVLASLRGAQNMIFDMMDEPEEVAKRIGQVTSLYQQYYDQFYQIVQDKDKGSAYTVFQIYGMGKTAKLQCDFSAMMSPTHFKNFIVDSLKEQAGKLDHVLYHLDGPDAIKHMDALMEIDGIDALQWTSGDHGPDGTFKEWDVIYDKASAAGKSLWVKVYTGEFEDWIRNADRLVQKYGSHSLFLFFPEMSLKQAEYLLNYAEEHWSDIVGTYKNNEVFCSR